MFSRPNAIYRPLPLLDRISKLDADMRRAAGAFADQLRRRYFEDATVPAVAKIKKPLDQSLQVWD